MGHELNKRWENKDKLTDEQKKTEIHKLLIEPTNEAYERELGVKLVVLKVHFANRTESEWIKKKDCNFAYEGVEPLADRQIMLQNFRRWTQEGGRKAESRNVGLWHILMDEGWISRDANKAITGFKSGFAYTGAVCDTDGFNVGISSIAGCSGKHKSCAKVLVNPTCTSRCSSYQIKF